MLPHDDKPLACLKPLELWAGPQPSAAKPIPYDQAINLLLILNHFGAQTSMYSGPHVMPGIGRRIRADAPNDELLRVRGPLKNVGVVAVQASLQFHDSHAAISHPD